MGGKMKRKTFFERTKLKDVEKRRLRSNDDDDDETDDRENL